MVKKVMMFLAVLVLSGTFLGAQEEKKGGAELLLRLNFEDEIKGNNSPVRDAKDTGAASQWGQVSTVLTATTRMGKNGKDWKPGHRVEGKSGYAYSFGGDEEKRYVLIPPSKEIEFGRDDFSIAFWIKTTAVGGHILVRSTSAPYWLLSPVNGMVRLNIRDNVSDKTNVAASGTKINDDKWHHVVITADRDDAAVIYVDGQITGSGKINSSKNIGIGVGGFGYNNFYFDGLLDSLSLYRGVLSAEEVKELFSKGI